MKSSISHVFAFVLMLTIFFFIAFISFEVSISNKVILFNLDRINYYDYAYGSINKNIKEYVVNDDLLDDYNKYITKDMIKEDVTKLINGEEVNHYLDFYDIVEKHDDNPDIDDLYAKNINKIYNNNIFPSKEFSYINKIKTKLDMIPIILIFVAIIVTLSVVLKYMNDKKKYINISIIGSFILLVIPFIFRLFIRRVLYGNVYYTAFIKSIIDTNLVMYIIIVLVIVVGLIIKEKISKKKA